MLELHHSYDLLDPVLKTLCTKLITSSRLMRYDDNIILYPYNDKEIRFVDKRLNRDRNPQIDMAYCCGRVLIDYNKNGKYSYYLYTPFIKNKKYSAGHQKHNSVSTKSEKKLFELVNEHVKPLSMDMLFSVYARYAKSRHAAWIAEGQESYQRALLAVPSCTVSGCPDDVLNALVAEKSNCGVFVTQLLNDLTGPNVVNAYEEHKIRSITPYMKHAIYKDDNKFTACDYLVNNMIQTTLKPIEPIPPEDACMETIRGQVAVLSMTPAMTLVPNVGCRASDNIFYTYGVV